MSLWYDIKHKNYASDAKSSWIRSYVDRMLSVFRGETDSKFSSHFSGTFGRHAASDIDCGNGNTLQQNLENESAERLSSDAAIRQEMLAEDAAIREEISAEALKRENNTNSLLTKIDEETSARNTALDLKVDKVEGKKLSSNDYTDEERIKLSGIEYNAQVNTVTSVADKTGAVTLSKADVGLSNVDNTADIDKPISTAMQTALNKKLNTAEFSQAFDTKANACDVLTKTNSSEFTPTSNYHPATKKYVDDRVSFAGGGDMLKTVYDMNNDGVVDNASNLDGQPPSYYAKTSQLSTLAPLKHSSTSPTYGVGNENSYGHVKLTDSIYTEASGTALSASAGKLLFDLYNSILSIPPKLTPVSPKGTVIGSNDWTGTGWFYTSSDTQYVANDSSYSGIGADPTGLVRVCLKPSVPISKFWNWTPLYLAGDTLYEFFYSPARGLYEGLIPYTTTSLSEIIQGLAWEHRPPQNLYYGSVSGLLGSYHRDATSSTSEVNNYFVKNSPALRDLHFNCFPTEEDFNAALEYLNASFPAEEMAKLDHNARNLLHLMLDVGCKGSLSAASTWMPIQSKYSGTSSYLPVETIDNGFPGI